MFRQQISVSLDPVTDTSKSILSINNNVKQMREHTKTEAT